MLYHIGMQRGASPHLIKENVRSLKKENVRQLARTVGTKKQRERVNLEKVTLMATILLLHPTQI